MRPTAGLLLALCATGCGMANARSVDVREQRDRLPFLREGQTMIDGAVAALGDPAARFEGGRVLVWRMKEDGDRLVSVFSGAEYNLMLAFDERGVLARFNLIEIR